MAKILILGAGVMGSALTVPAADNGHEVTLAATPLDDAIHDALLADRAAHPRLGAPLSPSVRIVRAHEVTPEAAQEADCVIVGVSTPGIPWAADQLARLRPRGIVALVTKGLVENGPDVPLTFADALPMLVRERGAAMGPLVGIGGPCIARDLAERYPTAVVYASTDRASAQSVKTLFETPYYNVSLSQDAVGVEASAALKNFYAIGVSAMMGRHKRGDEPVKNPLAAAFQQAVDEMASLTRWLGGADGTAHGLAGLGDLHVTVGGGRNSRLGRELGAGATLADVLDGTMAGETVEGVDVGRVLAPHISGDGPAPSHAPQNLPLARALIASIGNGGPLAYEAAA